MSFQQLMVDKGGPFDNSGNKIAGRANPDGGAVELVIKDRVVARTHVLRDGRYTGQFFFRCDSLMDYLGQDDVITLRQGVGKAASSHTLTASGGAGQTESRVDEIFKLIDDGYVLTKFGKFQKGWSLKRRHAVRDLFEAVSEVLDRMLALPVIPSAGNLLGAIREGDFIAHDAGAFDCVFVSRNSVPQDVRKQCLEVIAALSAAGVTKGINVKTASIFITSPKDRDVKLDLRWAWFNEEGLLDFSCGSRFQQVTEREAFFNFKNARIGDWTVRVPGNAEKVLYQFYGDNWRVPDQGNHTGAKQVRDTRYNLSDDEIQLANNILSGLEVKLR